MKVYLFLLMLLASFPGLTQENENKDEEKIPEFGTKVLPQKQEDASVPNPFQIGPYKDGNYLYTNPDRDPDARNSAENPP